MEVRIALQRVVFMAALLVLAASFAMRAAPLLQLYTDAALRTDTQKALTNIASVHGWLLSDLTLLSVATDGFVFEHRSHTRGEDPTSCYRYLFADTSFYPCGDSL